MFFLPRTPGEARGVLAKLAARAALVVSDDSPTFVVPAQNEAAAKRAPCAYFAVDDCAVVPLALFPGEEAGARTIRPKLARLLRRVAAAARRPEPSVAPARRLELPFDPRRPREGGRGGARRVVRIDHGVPGVEDHGGRSGGGATARRFRAGALDDVRRRPQRSFARGRQRSLAVPPLRHAERQACGACREVMARRARRSTPSSSSSSSGAPSLTTSRVRAPARRAMPRCPRGRDATLAAHAGAIAATPTRP